MLDGRRLLITGVATRDSIAYAVAEEAQRAGAEVILTSFGRIRSITERAARGLPRSVPILELDVTQPEDYVRLADRLERDYGGVDGALHAVAFAPADAFGGQFLRTPLESVAQAFHTSAFSMKALAEALLPLLPERSGRLVALDFDASGAWPIYDWMGVCKAALESITRYLARDLGARGIAVNLVAAGPIGTPTASSIPGFDEFTSYWGNQAPLGWDVEDPRPIARAVCFLLSEWAEGITGEILHVDGGYHAMAAPLRDPTAQPIAAPAAVGTGVESVLATSPATT